MDIQTIVLASRNPYKIEEMKTILSDLGIALKSTLDFPDLTEIEEDRLTLEGNALKKAKTVYNETGLPALADDTGLEVDALEGRPGVFSARFAGNNATYHENNAKLLEELSGWKTNFRQAQFRSVVAFVNERGSYTFEGVVRGHILEEPEGEGGFGYDPLFQPIGYNESFAEMSPEEKNRISHRGKAIQAFIKWLRNYII